MEDGSEHGYQQRAGGRLLLAVGEQCNLHRSILVEYSGFVAAARIALQSAPGRDTIGVMTVERSPLDRIRLPRREKEPLTAVLRRVGFAVSLIIFVALVVRIGRGGYVDITGGDLGLLDAVYYASVTVTTTGYGDITAVTPGARLATVLLITPARILFLILVVGTTVEVLTDRSRQLISTRRWRQRVQNHILICGFGATGQSAAEELVRWGTPRSSIVVVDTSDDAIEEASMRGFVAVQGDATQTAILEQGGAQDARAILITPNRDDTAVLITLTAREMSPTAHIVAGGREQENLHLLRQGGADQVIDATAAVGRMLSLATEAPDAVQVIDDLIDSGSSLELAEIVPEVVDGRARVPAGATLVSAIRQGQRLAHDDLALGQLRSDDLLIVLRHSPDRGAE